VEVCDKWTIDTFPIRLIAVIKKLCLFVCNQLDITPSGCAIVPVHYNEFLVHGACVPSGTWQRALLGCVVFIIHCSVYEAFAFEDHFGAV
jgi:hypothetical protein